jgi:hypothetical protein
MRFCQSDGTPLVDEAPVDPYKTMVARPEDIAAAIPPVKDEEEVLELPVESDPLKTMYASEEEIRKEMAAHDLSDEPMMEIPPIAPEPPKFSEPSLSPPPSPFAVSESESTPSESPFSKTSPPIPSPFGDAKPVSFEPPAFEVPAFEPPPTPNFPQYSEPVISDPVVNPFDQPFTPKENQAMANTEWTPPPAPDAGWQNQAIGQNTPFQPPPPGAGGLNQTLPIISLVLGIVSLCCYISPLTGIAALITGWLSLKNIKNDPANYGGKGLAIAGMITGGIFLLLGLLYWIYIIFVVGFMALGSMGNLG